MDVGVPLGVAALLAGATALAAILSMATLARLTRGSAAGAEAPKCSA